MININGTYSSKKCGPVKILEKLPNRKYRIRFLNTGTESVAREDAIRHGEIRDAYAPLNCNVACTGEIKTKGKYKKYYEVWNSMIHRCYAEQDGKYKAYRNVFVCDRWLIFKNFYEDCKKIIGFEESSFLAGELVLDKDLKQRYQDTKIYSPETCIWIPKYINNRIQDAQMKPFRAISPSGVEYKSDNITNFAKQHGLERKHISSVLHGRAKTTRGWQFNFCEEIV